MKPAMYCNYNLLIHIKPDYQPPQQKRTIYKHCKTQGQRLFYDQTINLNYAPLLEDSHHPNILPSFDERAIKWRGQVKAIWNGQSSRPPNKNEYFMNSVGENQTNKSAKAPSISGGENLLLERIQFR